MQIAFIAGIIAVAVLLLFNIDLIDLNNLNGFKIQFSKIMFNEQLSFRGESYDFNMTNGEGRLHVDNLDQIFVYLRILAAFIHASIFLMIIYFLRKIFINLTDNKYFISKNGVYIKYVGFSIILLELIPDFIYYFTDRLIIRSIEFDSIIIKNNFHFNYHNILLGLLVFVISIVFLRGIELKEDHDLTI
ncbi:MAG: DUF2975 domain-containing protein [Flavobacteriaceae bacterium]|nr:DUF2975 domain-containing protein [Flavobacteriaceae bacterium]